MSKQKESRFAAGTGEYEVHLNGGEEEEEEEEEEEDEKLKANYSAGQPRDSQGRFGGGGSGGGAKLAPDTGGGSGGKGKKGPPLRPEHDPDRKPFKSIYSDEEIAVPKSNPSKAARESGHYLMIEGDKDEIVASMIDFYTTDGYESMNASLRDGTAKVDDPMEGYDLIDKWTTFRLKEPTKVYRAPGDFGEDQLKKMKVGDTIVDKAYVSTSLSEEYAAKYSDSNSVGSTSIMEIKTSEGSYIQGLSRGRREYEMLLPRNRALKLTGVTERKVEGKKRTVYQFTLPTPNEATENYSAGQPRDSQGRFGSGGGGGGSAKLAPDTGGGSGGGGGAKLAPDTGGGAGGGDENQYIVGAEDPAVSSRLKRGHEKRFLDSLTVDEAKALSEYKGDDPYAPGAAIALNGTLRDGDKLSAEQQGALEQIDKAFRKAPRTKEEITVYRGTSEPLKENAGFLDSKAFVSTSVSREEAEGFVNLTGDSGYLYEISVPKGTKAMPTSHFHSFTSIAEESEVLLPRGVAMRITGRKGNVVQAEVVGGQAWMMGSKHTTVNRSEVENYSAGQPRDSSGKFGSGGGSGGSGGKLDPTIDADGDGVADAARVGVPARELPPPPKIPRLPNLTKEESEVEEAFASAFEKDPDTMASHFRALVEDEAGDGPKTFGTDDAKVMMGVWGNPPPEERSVNRAKLNTPLHQTANAIAKRAFVQELDTLKPGDELMVTVGGCGAGKGYALKNVPDAVAMKNKSKAVWDSAGDQNATENPWIQGEAEKRGLKVNYVYVDADPKTQWADPGRGVIKRAGDPKDGRMVDAKVFADSYAQGAKNHQAFADNNKDNANANFIYLQNKGPTPKRLPGIPKEALKVNAKELETFAVDTVKKVKAPQHVKDGALIGQRIWESE